MNSVLAGEARTRRARSPWWGGSVLLAATALSLLNSTIVNVALPSVQRGLDLSPTGVSWVLAGWALAYAILLVPAGRLGDRIGHRPVFMAGIGLFVISSIACGLAQNETQLVAFRIVQGLAGGMFYPAVAATLSTLFAGRARAKAFAVMGATIGVSAAVGPLLGGILIDVLPEDLGWRSVFLVNAPIGLLILIGAIVWLPRPTPAVGGANGSDRVGLLLLTSALAGLFVPLIIGQEQGWPAEIWLVTAAGVCALVGFVLWESRVDRTGGLALIPPRLFARAEFSIPVAISFVQFAGFVSIFYVLALLWETGLGHTPFEMGLLTLPEALGSIVGSYAVVRILPRLGIHTLTLGSALMAGGIGGVWWVLAVTPAADLTAWNLVLPLIVTGIGTGATIAPTLNLAIGAVDPRDSGTASGTVATLQRLGNGAGLAVVGAAFFATLGGGEGSPQNYVDAAKNGMIISTLFTVVGLLLTVLLAYLVGRRDKLGADNPTDTQAS